MVAACTVGATIPKRQMLTDRSNRNLLPCSSVAGNLIPRYQQVWSLLKSLFLDCRRPHLCWALRGPFLYIYKSQVLIGSFVSCWVCCCWVFIVIVICVAVTASVLRLKHKALYILGKYPTELNIHPTCSLIKNKDSLIVLIKILLIRTPPIRLLSVASIETLSPKTIILEARLQHIELKKI